jgi:hypothetical protein
MRSPGFTAEWSLGEMHWNYHSLLNRAPRLGIGVALPGVFLPARAIHGVSCTEICRPCYWLFECCDTICTDPDALVM